MPEAISLDFLALQQALVGRYSLIRELGRGGMGVVYLAQEVQLDRPVALKVLPPDLAARDEFRQRFLREARTSARLSHPHIVPIHAVHELDGCVFFAMAYVEGETLGERIRSRGPLPAREAARILREVAWALGYAHGQGVVHRDVKPDNILLEARGGRALVTDFGIAQAGAEPAADEAERWMGTAEFMSPEQAAGERVDARSDLYALGVVGYYALSGRLPAPHRAGVAATRAEPVGPPLSPLSSVVPGIPLLLSQALERCLERDAAQRFADGGELAVMVTRALEERRELPVALQLFIKQTREATVPIVATELFTAGSLTIWGMLFGLGIMDFGWGPLLTPIAVWVALGLAPLGMLVQMARRLQRSGYDHADLMRAMRDDLDARREDLAATDAPNAERIDRWLKRLFTGGLTTHLATLAWMMVGSWFPGGGEALGAILGLSLAMWVGAGSVTAMRHPFRGKPAGQGWLKFWGSALGRVLFRASRAGLEHLPAAAPYGPTEIAIGVAAERLFQALPTQQREAFSDLPATVRRLEVDAERMRAHLKELDALIDDADFTPAAHGAGSDVLAAELQSTRAAAADRLREVVAALETIRVELLRLHAGAASVESVTMDLRAARDLSSEIGLLLDARREVDRLLGYRTGTGLTRLPTPV